eukprot:CAMPEP_0172834970 /NCGR_PEP_ID=MMETSP1075-20121228/25406_1 /TAXON_ID=2916 /ORGANISM="Ceratium fusus, Strain PA161109" /LENGTH=81 /DNA_ID=CAMNT_0013677931 /DNA_START=31 /DNA_END=277 /DNA_ORIENTATION=-
MTALCTRAQWLVEGPFRRSGSGEVHQHLAGQQLMYRRSGLQVLHELAFSADINDGVQTQTGGRGDGSEICQGWVQLQGVMI